MRTGAAAQTRASGATLHVEREAEATRLVFAGRLDIDAVASLWDDATRAASSGDRLVVAAHELESLDGAGATLLVEIEKRARAAGASCAIEGLREDLAELLALLRPKQSSAPERASREPGFLARIGAATLQLGADLRALLGFVGELAVFLAYTIRHPGSLRLRDTVAIADAAGMGAVPIVTLVGFLLGLILAFQGAIPMQRFGAEIFVADLLGISMLRELGALMAAILLTARSGSAFAAEIGTMKVNEEVDALTTMGLEPVRFLVVPRVIAAVAVVPALTVLINLAALVGGLVVFVQLGFPPVTFVNRVLESVTMGDFLGGMGKAVVFGVLVAAVGCLRGIQTGSGAQAVGASTTSAVVSGIILIAITDGLFAVLFYVLGI